MTTRWKAALCCLGLLGLVASRPQPSAAQDEDLGDDTESSSDAPAAEPSGDATAAPEGADGEAAPEAVPAAALAPDAAEVEPVRDVIARAFVGGGLGTRSIRRPIPGGVQRTGTLFFPAADVGIAVRAFPTEAFTLDVLVRYETSLGLVVKEPNLFALGNEVDVRSEHAEVSVAPGFRLGPNATSPRVVIPIGGSFRNFWPVDHHLKTPRYTLIGPQARVELQVALGSFARLRVGPEIQMYGIIGTDLTHQGKVSSPSFAAGAEAGLEFRLSQTFLLEVEYRQSNAFASSTLGSSLLDVERFATVRLAGEM